MYWTRPTRWLISIYDLIAGTLGRTGLVGHRPKQGAVYLAENEKIIVNPPNSVIIKDFNIGSAISIVKPSPPEAWAQVGVRTPRTKPHHHASLPNILHIHSRKPNRTPWHIDIIEIKRSISRCDTDRTYKNLVIVLVRYLIRIHNNDPQPQYLQSSLGRIDGNRERFGEGLVDGGVELLVKLDTDDEVKCGTVAHVEYIGDVVDVGVGIEVGEGRWLEPEPIDPIAVPHTCVNLQ